MVIPYNRPHLTGDEMRFVAEAVANLHLSANGKFTHACQTWLEERLGAARVLLTHSGTGALEMAALLAGIAPGDEVIMPSFTFVSTANAVALRGGVPVFVDIAPGTLNLDADLVEAAITSRTRAICPVHYAGVGADMDAILAIAARHGLMVIEDAAHGLFAARHGRPLGAFGALAAISFHETKNVMCGEGGALIVNDPALIEDAETIWEKGTDRARFSRGDADHYTWQGPGSSFAPSDITAAFLWAQLQHGEDITARRLTLWNRYHAAFRGLEQAGLVRRPEIPPACEHNAHLYRLMLPDAAARQDMIAALWQSSIQAIFHYVPLHNSPAGLRHGRCSGTLRVTEDAAARLIRLPLHLSLSEAEQSHIIEAVHIACCAPALQS